MVLRLPSFISPIAVLGSIANTGRGGSCLLLKTHTVWLLDTCVFNIKCADIVTTQAPLVLVCRRPSDGLAQLQARR